MWLRTTRVYELSLLQLQRRVGGDTIEYELLGQAYNLSNNSSSSCSSSANVSCVFRAIKLIRLYICYAVRLVIGESKRVPLAQALSFHGFISPPTEANEDCSMYE